MLEWLRVDFIFSQECLTEEKGVISLYEHADSLEKVTTVKRVALQGREHEERGGLGWSPQRRPGAEPLVRG